jgi:hypothetical protein
VSFVSLVFSASAKDVIETLKVVPRHRRDKIILLKRVKSERVKVIRL